MRLLGKALTFDDVLLVPAFSSVLPRDTDLATRLSRNIRLNLPLVSAAMDTVTEARLAIAIAQEGGIGIVHKNLTPKQQAAEVARVKRYESGVLRDPITVTPEMTVREVMELAKSTASPASRCSRASRRRHRHQPRPALRDAPRRPGEGDHDAARPPGHGQRRRALAEGKALMHRDKLERVLVVNDAFELRGLMTVKDITKQTSFPNAARDAHGKLRVGAASASAKAPRSASSCSSSAGVDAIVVDTAHGHSAGVIDRVRWVKHNFPSSTSSAATSPPARRRWTWSRRAPTRSRSASARARSAPRASSPASACRR